MCGRYATFGPVSVSRQMKMSLEELGVDIEASLNQREPQYNIAPTQKAPAIYNQNDNFKIEALRWGLVPSWAKDLKIGASAINARAETLATKPMFRAAFKTRRALVPASGYYEWKGEAGAKQPYFIQHPDGELMMFAGLWEHWRDADLKDINTFTIITGNPGKVSGDIHDRQPVIIPANLCGAWLDIPPVEAVDLLRDLPEAELVYHAVSKAVGSPRNKGPELIEAIEL